MIVSIHQPEHFPYLGFFQKMQASDLFVILDNVKFQGRRSFQNRNRFLNKSGQEEWFTVPVAKGSYDKKINEVVLAPDYGWRKRLQKKLRHNFGKTYEEIYSSESLCEVNIKSIELCRSALNIDVPMIKASELECSGNKEALLASICRQVGATTYLSGQGAKKYLHGPALDVFGTIRVDFFKPDVPDLYSSISHII